MQTVKCAYCKMEFGMPDSFLATRQEDGQPFTCPAGHSNAFPKPLAQKLREEIAQIDAELKRLNARRRRLVKRIEKGK